MLTFIAKTDAKISAQIAQFCRIYATSTYAALLKADPDKISDLNKGSLFLIFILGIQTQMQSAAVTFTSYKDLLLTGKGGGVLGALPLLPVYPTSPAPPPIALADLETLFRDIIQQCVKSGNLTEDMAKALGIFEEAAVVTLEVVTPVLSLKYISAGHPNIHTKIGDYDAFEVWKDTGTGYVFLNVSTGPDFLDNSPLPAAGVDAVWNYKIIFRLKNVQVGNWSNVLSVAVKGV